MLGTLCVCVCVCLFFLPITVRCALASTGLAVLLLSSASQTYNPVSEVVGAGIMRRCPLTSRRPSRFHDTTRLSNGLRGEDQKREERSDKTTWEKEKQREWDELVKKEKSDRRQLHHIKSISLYVNEAGNEWWQSVYQSSQLHSAWRSFSQLL